MCRMFAYSGRSRSEVLALLDALVRVSSNDGRLKAFYGLERHGDGWGYVIRTADRLFQYQSRRPIYDDDSVDLPAFRDEAIQAIFHSRLSPKGVLGDAVLSHPYATRTDRGIFYLVHNGGLSKNTVDELRQKDQVDSERVLEEIAAHGSFKAALPRLTDGVFAGTTLNLILMTVERDSARNEKQRRSTIEYLNQYSKRGDGKDGVREAYLQMYHATVASGAQAVFSSTLKDVQIEGFEKAEIELVPRDVINVLKPPLDG